MMKLTIKRSEWTGSEVSRQHDEPSALTPNDQGRRCCLGHLIVAYNPQFLIFEAARNLPMPRDVPTDYVPEWLVGYTDTEDDDYNVVKEWTNTPVASQLAFFNDDPKMAPELKEALIAYTLEMYDVDCEFVD